MEIEELIKGRWYRCDWDGTDLIFQFKRIPLAGYVDSSRWKIGQNMYNDGTYQSSTLSNIRPCYSPELQEIIDREMPIDRPYNESIEMIGNLSSKHQDEIAGDTPENKARTLLLEEAKRRFPMGSTYKSPSGNNQFVDFDLEWQNNNCISKSNKRLAYGKLSGWATLVDNRKPAPKQDDLSSIDKMEGAMIQPKNYTTELPHQVVYGSIRQYMNTGFIPLNSTIKGYALAHQDNITIIRPSKRKTLSTDIPSTNSIRESIKHNK